MIVACEMGGFAHTHYVPVGWFAISIRLTQFLFSPASVLSHLQFFSQNKLTVIKLRQSHPSLIFDNKEQRKIVGKRHNGTARFKNVNNCLNTNIYSYLETSGGQSFYLKIYEIHFFNTNVYYTTVAA